MAKEKKPQFTEETVIGTDEPKTDIDGAAAAGDTENEDLGKAAASAAASPAPGKHPDKGGEYRFEDGNFVRVK